MPEPTVRLRAAIVGTGRIASTYDDEVVNPLPAAYYQGENRHAGMYTVLPVNHAESYQTTPGFDLVAAANRGADKLHAFGERRGVRALYTDFRQMLRQEQPDVVSVCTQSADKAEVTVAAAEAGVKAIIVEKAMATSMAEADAMIAACERNGVFLAVNHPYRFSPIARESKRLIEDGVIGPLTTMSVHSLGGTLHVGTHSFDLLRYWAGDAVTVHAQMPGYVRGKDQPARGWVEFADGVTAFFDHTHGEQPQIEARGKDGYLTVSTLVGDGVVGRFAPMYAPDAVRKYPNRLRLESLDAGPHDVSLTQRLLAEVHATLTGGAPFVSTGRDGAAALELGIACHLSHLSGGPVTLPITDRDFRVENR
ncbi:MAG: Gfo/Idh/MocA family oxidoreductase [Caldilineaceae bacterium]|nr:Gfo/Idh/MocA family oxidoreductase [Caldilineaceae bacterium]